MPERITRYLCLALAVLFMAGNASSDSLAAGITADHSVIQNFDQIPDSTLQKIADNFRFYYGHTSHGSQIMSGLDIVEAENARYVQPYFQEVSTDLGHNGDTAWVPLTRAYLNANPTCNYVMWSWCAGVSDNTEAGINIYLNAMHGLEMDYPTITFIYMTGHLDGTGPTGNLYQRNNQIRTWCDDNNKILFDFADIESYDPNGAYYPNESDACGWCSDWCTAHSCETCVSCAHSHCFNCYQKAKAFWWLLATVDGWSMPLDVDDPTDPSLPQSFRLKQNYPNPFNPVTNIRFDLPKASSVKLEVYDLLGSKVATLADEYLRAGLHSFSWDGSEAASGVYLYRLETDYGSEAKKMLLLK